MAWNELELVRFIGRTFGARGLAGARGNDAAALARRLERPVVCVDQTVAGVHFEPGAPARAVGHKACARPLSDLAASAASPRCVLAALALGPEVEAHWVRGVLRGIASTAERHGAILAGGDLSGLAGGGAGAVVSVTAVGERALGGRPVGRERARVGDLVLVTGPCGGSRRRRHLCFEPRVAAGIWLARAGARCLMDTTDGLALDLERIAAASGVRIDLERVPVHREARAEARRSGRSPFDHALHDGEDHELVASLAPGLWPEVERRAERELAGVVPGLECIGRVRRGRGLFVPAPGASNAPIRLVRWCGGGFVHRG